MANKPSVVTHGNVWISGLIFGGAPREIIKRFISGEIEVVVSEELLTELRRKVSQKFPIFVPKLHLLEASIKEDAFMVKLGSQTVTVCRDADDNKVIETALVGGCDYIITGDKDLLVFKNYQGIQIVRPAEFLLSDRRNS